MFELLPHTADVAVRAVGKTQEELFRSLLQGMFTAAEPREADGEIVERPFETDSPDMAALMVDFLNEALALSDINREAYRDVRFSALTGTHAAGVLVGKPVDGFETQIKAATHHDLQIKTAAAELEATVTFDV
jgi:SHS2 domain-containing protein